MAKPAPALAPVTGSALAVVGNYLGRWYLLVGGVTLAFEGDKCRDYGLGDGTLASQPWTRDMMERAAAKINALAQPNAKLSDAANKGGEAP